jgi:replication factor A1
VSDFIKEAPEAGSNYYMPISALNLYSHDWNIKARVLKRAQIRTYKNARGEGKILNIDLIDREGTMI